MKICPVCGAQQESSTAFCGQCGYHFSVIEESISPTSNDYYHTTNHNIIGKKRITLALISIFLGQFGIHKFLQKKPIQGIIYILLFVLSIISNTTMSLSSILGVIEGIRYLCLSNEHFSYI